MDLDSHGKTWEAESCMGRMLQAKVGRQECLRLVAEQFGPNRSSLLGRTRGKDWKIKSVQKKRALNTGEFLKREVMAHVQNSGRII